MTLAPCTRCATQISPEAPSCPRCGQPAPTLAAVGAAKSRQIRALLTLAAIGLGLWAFWSYVATTWAESSRKSDAETCAKWLGYYEAMCKANPDKCKEGARKLAKCE